MLIFEKELCSKYFGGCEKCPCSNYEDKWCDEANGEIAEYSDFTNRYIVCDASYTIPRECLKEVEE